MMEHRTVNKISTYIKISNVLRDEIRNGTYSPFNSLPSEKDIARRFDVAILTVRRAFSVLVNEGLIEKSRGKRAVVCPPKQTEMLAVHPRSNTPYLQSKERIDYETCFKGLVNPSAYIREMLQIPWAIDQVAKVTRKRKLNGRVISAYDVYFRISHSEPILHEHLKNESILIQMRNDWDLVPHEIVHQIDARPSDETIADLLHVPQGKMVFVLESIEFNQDRIPYCHFVEYYQLDRYKFQIKISG